MTPVRFSEILLRSSRLPAFRPVSMRIAPLAILILAAVRPLSAESVPARLWLDPGPERSPGGGPALLVVHPVPDLRLPAGTAKTRFAGRTDPPDARVLINGSETTLYEGGVFTGLFDLAPGENRIEFRAVSPDGETLVSRTVIRALPPTPAPASPGGGTAFAPDPAPVAAGDAGQPGTTPFRGTVSHYTATFLRNPEGWDRHGNLMEGTPLPLVRGGADRVMADFGRGRTGWLEREHVTIEPSVAAAPLPALAAPSRRLEGTRSERLTLTWKTDAPVAVVFETLPATLVVSMIGAATLEAGEIKLPSASPFRSATLNAGTPDSPPSVEVRLRTDSLWGYDTAFNPEDGFSVTIRSAPDIGGADAESPLSGLRIVVDAGHGGEDQSAIGPSGLTEADVNLFVALGLGRELSRLGAEVMQIREDDRTIGLDSRVISALAAEPDLFVSVHHNAVAMDTDPMTDAGPIMFYHYEHSRGAASALARRLNELYGIDPSVAPRVLRQNFRVNRNISICPSVLAEGGFICNPADEIRLRDAQFLNAMARALAAGITDVCGRSAP